MPVPTAITDLSQTAASNFPAGSSAPSVLDDTQRAHASFIATLRDGKGFTTPVVLASAGTTDIGATNAFGVEISGTTTITSFGTSYNGPRFLKFASALTLTHNASTLILPGGANIITAAGDTCIVMPKTTAGTADGWAVFSYQVAGGVTSVNAGQLAGLRNAVVNGNGLVQQRTAPTLTAALQYGAADRHLVGVTGGTGLSGTVNVLANSGFSCGVGYGAVAASWTTGSFIFKHRIEGANTKQFNSKTITVSGKLYQDTGGSRNLTVSFGKPTTTLDTFSAVTNLGTSSAIAVPSGTVTPFSYTLAMGTTDASLGLEVLITDNTTNTVLNKNYLVGDLQVEIGSVATVFEQRSIALESALAQRYYEIGTTYVTGHAPAGQFLGSRIGYKVQKRVTPTLVLTSALASNVDAASTVAVTPAADVNGFGVFRGGTSAGQSTFGDTWTASAEL